MGDDNASNLTNTNVTNNMTSSSSLTFNIPSFFRDNPSIWFRTVEALFKRSRIEDDDEKLDYLLIHLPPDILCLFESATSYSQAKDIIISRYAKSEQQKINEALCSFTLGSEKPSVAILNLSRKLQDIGINNDAVVRSKILESLPSPISILLSAHQTLSLPDFSKVADTVYEAHQMRSASSAVVNAVTSQPDKNQQHNQQQYQQNNQQQYLPSSGWGRVYVVLR